MGQRGSKEAEKGQPDEESVKLDRSRHVSSKSAASYGATSIDGSVGRPPSRVGSGVYVKRCSITATSSGPFERPMSSFPSGRSLVSRATSNASVRTRLTSVSRSEYHKDLKVSLSAGLTRNLIFSTFIIAFGCSFLFGYNIGVLNNPVDLIKEFYNETYTNRSGVQVSQETVVTLWSLTTALFLPGGMAGAFLGGALADKYGRKKSILFAHIFAFLGAAISCACKAAKSPEMLMIGRILFGINSGLGNCLAPMMLTEISPFNLRGALGTVHQLAITLGILFSSVFGIEQLLGTPTLWPYLLLLEAIPAALSLAVLPFLPESPRYLLLVKRQREAAEKALQFFRQSEDVTLDMEEMDTEGGDMSGDDVHSVYTLKKLFMDRNLWMPLFIACALQVVQQFSGINAIFFYSAGIFKNAKVSESQIPFAVIGANAVNVAMTLISVPLMDIAGRRILLLVPMTVMVVDLILITISLNLQARYEWMSIISVAAVIIYVICFAVGLGPIPMMIGSELFRQGPRPLAMACAGVVNWVFTFIVAMAFEPIQLKLLNYTFVLFLVMMITFVIFIYFKVPETRGKTFEEIAHQFAPGGHVEVEEMVEDDVFDNLDGDLPPEAPDEDARLVTVNFRLGSHDEDDGDDNVKGDIPMNAVTPTEAEKEKLMDGKIDTVNT